MKKLWDLKKVLSYLELEGQGHGIIMEVTRPLLLGPFYILGKMAYHTKQIRRQCTSDCMQYAGLNWILDAIWPLNSLFKLWQMGPTQFPYFCYCFALNEEILIRNFESCVSVLSHFFFRKKMLTILQSSKRRDGLDVILKIWQMW